jgi:ActR/RegA family two-component response regulator
MTTESPVIVLVGGDLSARARLLDAASRAGVELVTTTPEEAAGVVEATGARLVVLDLDEGRDRALDAVASVRVSDASPRVVGYFSHIDRELQERARAAGCEAFPRGRFWRELHELMGRP